MRTGERPLRTVVLALSCGLVLAGLREAARAETPPTAKGADSDALYEKVFKQKRQAKTQQMDLPVRFDGQELGLVAARVPADPSQAQLQLGSLADLLAGKVQGQVLETVRAAAGPDGFGRPAAVPEDAVRITVDTNELQVVVEVPPANRERQRLDVLGRSRLASGYLAVPNADVAAYSNVRASMEYLQRPDGAGLASGRQPASIAFENAVNIAGWVVEADAFYHEGGPRRWGRGAVRLLRDFVDSRVRAQVGDIIYPVSSVQTGRALGGINVARNFTLQPYLTSQPSGQREFVLEAPSVVEVLVNGRPARSFRLQPGPYSLSDFPGTTGTNDVRVRISDIYGREQIIEFPFFFDSQLLEKGLHEFSYALGYPSTVSNDRYTYDTSLPTVSMYHRVGVTDNLTLGVNAQADHIQQIYGTEVLIASPLGTLSVEPALSRNSGILGTQVTVRYRDYRNGAAFWQQRTINVQGTWRDDAFATLGTLTPRNTVSYDVSARVSQPITQSLVATVSGRYQKTRDPTLGDGHSIDLSLRQRLGRLGSVDLTVSHGRDTAGQLDIGAYLSVRLNFYEGRLSAGASVDTIQRERRIDMRYQDLSPVDSVNAVLDLIDGPGNDSADATLAYTHQRFESSVRHNAVRTQDDDGKWRLENRTAGSFSTAFAFADGHVAVSRPISNSFAMIVPHPRLKGRTVGVDPINGHYLSESDWLGPPVVPNISAYFSRPLLLAVPDAPATYDIGNDRPTVQPGYKTGALVPIGTDATVSISGGFILGDGAPASLLSGELQPLDDPSHKAVPFFTNRKGRFRVESVRPGKWQLILFGHEAEAFPLEIAPDAEGVVDAGTLNLKAGNR